MPAVVYASYVYFVRVDAPTSYPTSLLSASEHARQLCRTLLLSLTEGISASPTATSHSVMSRQNAAPGLPTMHPALLLANHALTARDHEVSQILADLNNAKANYATLETWANDEIHRLSNNNTILLNDINVLAHASEQWREQAESKKDAVATLAEVLRRVEGEQEKLKKETNDKLIKVNNKFRKELREQDEEMTNATGKIAVLEGGIEEHKNCAEEERKVRLKAEEDLAAEKLVVEDIRGELEIQKQECKKIEANHKDLNEELKDEKAFVASLQGQLRDHETTNDHLRTTIAEKDEQITEIGRARDDSGKSSALLGLTARLFWMFAQRHASQLVDYSSRLAEAEARSRRLGSENETLSIRLAGRDAFFAKVQTEYRKTREEDEVEDRARLDPHRGSQLAAPPFGRTESDTQAEANAGGILIDERVTPLVGLGSSVASPPPPPATQPDSGGAPPHQQTMSASSLEVTSPSSSTPSPIGDNDVTAQPDQDVPSTPSREASATPSSIEDGQWTSSDAAPDSSESPNTSPEPAVRSSNRQQLSTVRDSIERPPVSAHDREYMEHVACDLMCPWRRAVRKRKWNFDRRSATPSRRLRQTFNDSTYVDPDRLTSGASAELEY